MKERLRASDYRFILICAVLLAATTWFSVRNFYRAFPEASIDFKVSRAGALNIAEHFLRDQGYRLEDYRQAAQFTFDDQAKTFLERELGLERANRIMGTRVRLWRWAYRWFRPLQKEEYNVEITPPGQLAGFQHALPGRRCPPHRHACAGARPGRRLPPHPPRPRPRHVWTSSSPPTSPAPTASTAPSPGRSAISSWTTPPTAWKSPSSAMRSAAIASTSRSPNSGPAITSACVPRTKSPPPSIPP